MREIANKYHNFQNKQHYSIINYANLTNKTQKKLPIMFCVSVNTYTRETSRSINIPKREQST